MNFAFAARAVQAGKLAVKAKGPTLMVVGGVVSMGAAVVTAGKQTLKVEEVLAKHTPSLERVQQGQQLSLDSYTENDARNDRIKVYTRAGIDLGKLYAIPGVLFIGGAGMVFGGHRMMLQRNATLAIGFTALQRAFDAYRGRVVSHYGDETDQAMLNGWTKREVFDDKTGEVKQIAVRDWDGAEADPYNRVFEQGESSEWRPDLGLNKFFVNNQQRMAQQLLNHKGVLYLSEVYEALGFDETPLSRVVGWKVKRNPDGSRDIPIVDFGIDKKMPDDWKYSQEHAIYLDFNCQGLIVGGAVQKILEKA